MSEKSPTSTRRFALVDALRGMAIVMMFVYHFSWDLNNYNFVTIDFFRTPFWLHFRTVIVTTFLLVMGISLSLAHQRGINRQAFLKRLYWLLGCSLLITLSTIQFNGERFIYFGILHFITVASVLALPLVRYYWLNLLLGIGIIAAGTSIQYSLFDPRYLNWVGFVTTKPLTDDYVPLFPWFGIVLLGIFFAQWAHTRQHLPLLANWRGEFAAARLLRFAGRHSLLIYMLHQPVFIGIVYTVHRLLQ